MNNNVALADHITYLEDSRLKRWRRIGLFAIGALAATVVTTIVVSFWPGTYIHNMILERGKIPYLELFFFWLALVNLGDKLYSRWKETEKFNETCNWWASTRSSINPNSMTIRVERSGSLFQSTKGMDPDLLKSKAGHRVYCAVRRFDKTKSSKEVDDVLRTLSDMDIAENESSYSNLRFFIWLIPTLGFIGTVIGIGLGISGFGDIIKNASSFEAVQKQIPIVTHNLGIAFDTTLLALLLTAVILMIMSYLQKRDEDLLYKIDAFCVEEITGSFEERSEEDELAEKLAEELKKGRELQVEELKKGRDLLHKLANALAKRIGEIVTGQTKELKQRIDGFIGSKGFAELRQNVGKIESRFDSKISVESKKIVAAIPSGNLSSLRKTLEDLKRELTERIDAIISSEGFAQLRKSVGNMESRFDSPISELKTAITDSSDAGILKQTIESFEAAAKNTAENLQGVIQKLDEYVEKSGVPEAAKFTEAVSELQSGLKPMEQAVSLLAEASGKIGDLSGLSTVARVLENAAEQMLKGGKDALDGGAKIGEAGADLTGVISENKVVLEEVKTVMTHTTNSITDLSKNIVGMLKVLSAISQAVIGVQENILELARQIERIKGNE
jgi:biopolymer transport protein ExbB/TolQ